MGAWIQKSKNGEHKQKSIFVYIEPFGCNSSKTVKCPYPHEGSTECKAQDKADGYPGPQGLPWHIYPSQAMLWKRCRLPDYFSAPRARESAINDNGCPSSHLRHSRSRCLACALPWNLEWACSGASWFQCPVYPVMVISVTLVIVKL